MTSPVIALPEPILSARLTSRCPHRKPSNKCCGYAEWLQVIHAINRLVPGAIGEPIQTYQQSGGRWFEDYPDFRVILKDEQTNYVQARTPSAAEALRAAFLEVTGLELQA